MTYNTLHFRFQERLKDLSYGILSYFGSCSKFPLI